MEKNLKDLYNQHRDQTLLSAAAKQRVKDKVFQRLSEPIPAESLSTWAKLQNFTVRGYVLAPLALLLLIAAAATSSAHSLPGDFLYPVKRQVENAQVLLAPTEQTKLNLQLDFAQKRLQELETVQQIAPPTPPPVQPQNTQPNEPQQSSSEQKQTKAQQAVQQTLNSLEQTKQHLQDKGDNPRAEILKKAITNYKERLNKDNDLQDSKNSHQNRTQEKDSGNNNENH